jgi:hypothetical protein
LPLRHCRFFKLARPKILIESLQKFHHYFGDGLKVEFPSRSGKMRTLSEVAAKISRRLTGSSCGINKGAVQLIGAYENSTPIQTGPISFVFYEYFHGDTGQGLGASHQTGWTAVVPTLLQQSGDRSKAKGRPG